MLAMAGALHCFAMPSADVCACNTRLRSRRRLGFLCFLFLLPQSGAVLAQEKTQCTLPDCDQAKAFFQKLQQAVDADKKQEVARMVRCPLHSYRNGKETVYTTKSRLLAGYGAVFTPGVRCAIKTATLEDVWGNWRGFTISAGAIWWDRIIPNSAANLQPSDLSKYPFGVFGVNHGPETDKQCPANQGIPLKP
jgi:hypothetical protein